MPSNNTMRIVNSLDEVGFETEVFDADIADMFASFESDDINVRYAHLGVVNGNNSQAYQ